MARRISWKNLQDALIRRVRFSVFAAALCLLSAHLLASVWHPCEWATHFTPHAALFIVSGAYFLPRCRRVCFFCAGLALLAFAVGPFSGDLRDHGGEEGRARVLSYNLKFDNAEKDAEARSIADADADVVVLIEAGGHDWRAFLENLRKSHPHSCGHDVDGPFAMRLLAKQAPAACEVKFSGI